MKLTSGRGWINRVRRSKTRGRGNVLPAQEVAEVAPPVGSWAKPDLGQREGTANRLERPDGKTTNTSNVVHAEGSFQIPLQRGRDVAK